MNDIAAEIERVANDIKEVLKNNRVPTPNKNAINRLQFLSGLLPAGYAREKAREIASKSEVFYSARKHEKYAGGASLLFAQMEGLVNRILSYAKSLHEEINNA